VGTTDVPVCELALAAVPTAVRCSRAFVRRTLHHWRLDHLSDDAELVTSELVTNAVRATGLTGTPLLWSQLTHLAMIQVRLTLREDTVLIEVRDREAAVPVLQEPGEDQENNRGLQVVVALSAEWGYYHVPRGGKVVWARLAIPGPVPVPGQAPEPATATGGRAPRTQAGQHLTAVAAGFTRHGISTSLTRLGDVPVLTIEEPTGGPSPTTISIAPDLGAPGLSLDCTCLWTPGPGATPQAIADTIIAVLNAIRPVAAAHGPGEQDTTP
jgi:hypothetical protein